jgi:ubiquitin conjugation factor E4 B
LDEVGMIYAFLVFQVKLDKVDVFYPFHPYSLVDVKNDTRLKFTSQEAAAWLDDLSE